MTCCRRWIQVQRMEGFRKPKSRKDLPIKVYLDDIRLPDGVGWTIARTRDEAVGLLKTGEVEELSLDHDLGDEDVVGNGYRVLLWLEEQVARNGFRPPVKMKVHSANAGARPKMELAIKKIQELWEAHEGRG